MLGTILSTQSVRMQSYHVNRCCCASCCCEFQSGYIHMCIYTACNYSPFLNEAVGYCDCVTFVEINTGKKNGKDNSCKIVVNLANSQYFTLYT